MSIGSGLASVVDATNGNAVRAYYIGADQHVHELFLSGGHWQDGDLMVITGGLSAAAGSAIASLYDPLYQGVRTDYIGTDQHVHELFLSGSAWQDADLTAITGGSSVLTGTGLAGTVDTANSNAARAYHIDTDQHVHELFLSQGYWQDGDIMVITGGLNAVPWSSVATVFDQLYQGIRTDYIGTDEHVHELFLSGSAWQDADLTNATGAPNVSPPPIVSGQVTAGGTPLSGVTVTLSGTIPATTTTDGNGNYSFAIPEGGTYTVTPSDSIGDSFSPPSASFSDLSSPETQNFSVDSSSTGGSGTFIPELAESTLEELPSESEGSTCTNITGTWTENTDPEATWTLSQSGQQVTESVAVNGGQCGTVTWTVTGSLTDPSAGSFTLYSTNPKPTSCANNPYPSATDTVTLDATQCTTGSGTHTVPSGSFSTIWQDPNPAATPVPTSLKLTLGSKSTYSNQTIYDACSGEAVGSGWGYTRCAVYTVLDQTGKPILNTTNYMAKETRTYVSGMQAEPHTGSGAVNQDGVFSDFLAWVLSSGPIPTNANGVRKQVISIQDNNTGKSTQVRVNCLVFTASDVAVNDVTSSANQSCNNF